MTEQMSFDRNHHSGQPCVPSSAVVSFCQIPRVDITFVGGKKFLPSPRVTLRGVSAFFPVDRFGAFSTCSRRCFYYWDAKSNNRPYRFQKCAQSAFVFLLAKTQVHYWKKKFSLWGDWFEMLTV